VYTFCRGVLVDFCIHLVGLISRLSVRFLYTFLGVLADFCVHLVGLISRLSVRFLYTFLKGLLTRLCVHFLKGAH
jgi:hypothetical protein